MTLNSFSLKSVLHLFFLDQFNKQKANAVFHLGQDKTEEMWENTSVALPSTFSREVLFSYQPCKHRSHTKHTNHSLFPLEAAAAFLSDDAPNTKDSPSADLRELGKTTLLTWMKDGHHRCFDVWSEVTGFQVLAELKDDGGTFPLYLWMLGSGDKDHCRGLGRVNASLWLGTLACIPYLKSPCLSDDDFSQMLPNYFMSVLLF